LYKTALELKEVIMIGHSTGGGEVARYIGRHGTSRVAKAVLIGTVRPLMLKTAANSEGRPIDMFDGIRAGFTADRSQCFKDLAVSFFGFNREGAKTSQGAIDSFWSSSMLGSIKGEFACIKAFSETDFTKDLKDRCADPDPARRRRPDRADRGLRLQEPRTGQRLDLHVVKVGSHGMHTVEPAEINDILLGFIKE